MNRVYAVVIMLCYEQCLRSGYVMCLWLTVFTQWLCCVMNSVYAVVMLCYEQSLRSDYVVL